MRNPVAPGDSGYNLLCSPGIAGRILGNFDRQADTEETPQETNRRILRPGAILLANLDISPPLVGSRPRGEHLDAADDRVGSGDDSREMATLKIRKPDPCNLRASHVVLRVHEEDAPRIRVFPHARRQPVYLGRDKGTHSHETTTAGNDHEYELPPTASPWAFHDQIEAVTLAGSPRAPGPCPLDDQDNGPATPPPPTPYEVLLPTDPTTPVNPTPTNDPIHDHRLIGEVWFELAHLDHAFQPLPDAHQVRDVAVYTIAPWLMQSNLHRAQVLYISDLSSNQDTVRDVERAFTRHISGVTLRKITPTECDNDPWVQDEFEIGYCWAVHNWMHVVVHLKRSRGLHRFVRDHLLGDDMGLFDDITEDLDPLPHDPGDPDPRDAINYGGNLEVSPPVDSDTTAMAEDSAGPAVPAHRRAPFGKIILGHSADRRADTYFRYFLEAQKVQPILYLDTAWLDVGHVDEFMSFVPANSGKPFRMLMASTSIATSLLEEALTLHNSDPSAHLLTRLLRGKTWQHYHPSGADPSEIVEPPRIFQEDTGFTPDTDPGHPEEEAEYHAAITVEGLLDAGRTFNDELESLRLLPLEQRLTDGLNLNEAEDIIHLPVYFDSLPAGALNSGGQTSAFTPDVVNLQVVNEHLLPPRHFGPRMRRADAGQILRGPMGLSSATDARLGPFEQHEYWALQNEELSAIAGYFSDGGVTAAEIRSANPGKFDPAGRVRNNWTRLLIPERTVDLFEAYTQIRLEDIGCRVHWIDDWYTYHRNMGEVHCGTNAKRRPPELDADSSFTHWWDYYAELVR